MVEPSVYDPNGRTEVITFPVEGPDFGIYRDDLSAVQHLDYVQRVQRHWVQAGRRHERHAPQPLLIDLELSLAGSDCCFSDRIDDAVRFSGWIQVLMGVMAVLTLPLYVQTFDWMAAILLGLKQNEFGYVLFTTPRPPDGA